MKTSRGGFVTGAVIVIGGLLLALHWSLAQEETTSPPIPGLSPVVEEEMPEFGTFWSLQKSDSEFGEPPLPFNPFPKLPLYSLGIDDYLIDDRTVDYVTLRENVALHWALKLEEARYGLESPLVPELGIYGESEGGMMMLMGGPPSLPGEGGEEGGGGWTNYVSMAYSYGSNVFWIEITTVSNGLAHLVLHGTTQDETYELQSREHLTNAVWVSEAPMVIGAEGQDWTAATVEVGTRTNTLFFRARSWVDSDGDGLPDWWELENGLDPETPDTGNTGIPDGYKDDDEDGWNNLQEYRNGTNPNDYNTPPPPQGFAVTLNPSGTAAKLSWHPVNGTVTGYTIQRSLTNLQTQVSSSTTSYEDTQCPLPTGLFFNAPAFRVQANYSSGDSAWSPWRSPEEYAAPDATLFHGEAATITLRVPFVPATASAIRFGIADYHSGGYFSVTNFDVSVASITNGLAVVSVPYSVINDWSYLLADWYANWVSTNGVNSAAQIDWFTAEDYPPFWDGRAQMKENLVFLLRAAFPDEPFAYTVSGGNWSWATSWWHDLWPDDHVYVDFWENFNVGSVQRFRTEFEPFVRNHHFKNFVLGETNFNEWGAFVPSITWPFGIPTLSSSRVYEFEPPLSIESIPSLLDTNSSRWLYGEWLAFGDLSPLGIEYIDATEQNPSMYAMSNGVRNHFGLPYVSATLAVWEDDDPDFYTLYAGGTIPTGPNGKFYPETAQPELVTVGHYFGQVNKDPLPGDTLFSVTNQTPLLVGSVGTPIQIAGYTKFAIANGYNDKFAYLGQYFDKAYKTTNGVATTNRTGILSPYGEFFPTEPGLTALLTLPDIDTGQRGTGVVHVIKLQLDVNHDGVMDTTYYGPDNTSADRPFTFWVNNDHDTWNGKDLDNPKNPNHTNNMIDGVRDLEDFARLWIVGLPELPAFSGYDVQLKWRNTTGNPIIKLYRSADESGGTGYLTSTNVAVQQTQLIIGAGVTNGFGASVGTVAQGATSLADIFFSPYSETNAYLFEGAGIGSGELVLTVLHGTNVLAQSSVWIDLCDVKAMYEQTYIAYPPASPPSADTADESVFLDDVTFPPRADEAKQVIVFVHGWRMPLWEYENFSESMFKRLYWTGYQGRFASLRWPCLSIYTDGTIGQWLTFNRSEFIAFKSAQGTEQYFRALKERLPDYSINVAAHSQGNILMMETLKRFVQNGDPVIDNYVLMESAVPAHCYDTSITNYPPLANATNASPNTYFGYATNIGDALRLGGQMVNFYSELDAATVFAWETNQKLNKPDYIMHGYDYISATGVSIRGSRTITDPREQMAFVARPRSKAAGSQAGVQGVIQGGEVDLKAEFGFGDSPSDHSGQFNRAIQSLGPFYRTLGVSLGVIQPE